MMFFKKNKRGGFTLIELLVVISIIGLLSSIILASLASAREKARSAVIAQNFKTLQTAIEAYNATEGYYPYQNGDIPDAIETDGLFRYEIGPDGNVIYSTLAEKLASSYFCDGGSTCPAVIPDYVDLFPSSGIYSIINYAVDLDIESTSDNFDAISPNYYCGEGTAPMKGYYIMLYDNTGIYDDIPLPHLYQVSSNSSLPNIYCLTGN